MNLCYNCQKELNSEIDMKPVRKCHDHRGTTLTQVTKTKKRGNWLLQGNKLKIKAALILK